ncbi:hypothetical protein H6G96_21270 [Nostoc sp. FACHB-892]|uniref:hypothetical protein n=1 Tax=Nostoc sp. FACHB-892 TaxID=2692843 RepID=UPI001683A20B|nr:hypothetical protein [Nostoc sp. FACHB-892]MBD2728784.1 hypothetical protein [Nostoc sp. FACHB-892]
MTDNRQQLTVNDCKECLYNLGAHQFSSSEEGNPPQRTGENILYISCCTPLASKWGETDQ